jgi:hypothetical protein
MANLGNAWHIPDDPEPRGRGGMRDPIGPIVPDTLVTIFSGNQYQGAGNPGNQLQDGSALLFRRQGDPNWTTVPMLFASAMDNNKYYSADLATDTFQAGDIVQYYLQIAYDDHDKTFLHAAGEASVVTGDEATAQATPYSFMLESSEKFGHWSKVFLLPNVAIHAHLLPTGKVLFWGRRDQPEDSLDVNSCTPHIWDPSTGAVTQTDPPKDSHDATINLFCSGHTFLSDGRLLVVGGHLHDSEGLQQSCVYDPVADTWTPSAEMNHGRWYPSALTLSTGAVLVLSGSYHVDVEDPVQKTKTPINNVPQVWTDGEWGDVPGLPDHSSFDLYPRVHVQPSGAVLMTGGLTATWSLQLNGGTETWSTNTARQNTRRDYACSVLYDVDKIIYIGGGNDADVMTPTPNTEKLDLSHDPIGWHPGAPMHFARRQHNATILPDGTILVTGGTRGSGGTPGATPGFNDLTNGQPVHTAELWDPKDAWTELAAESVDRCYHSTAVLLPDATVLSAGGGEYRPTNGPDPNLPEDSHRDAQIFSPPYLFIDSPRPEITAAPASIDHATMFHLSTPQASDIAHVTLLRLSSVTHSFNSNQRINFLDFEVAGNTLKVTSPPTVEVCPPGHYMLFIISAAGVPSVAKVLHVSADAAVPAPPATRPMLAEIAPPPPPPDALELQASIRDAATGTKAVLGITGTCPYGLGACWGGAHEALLTLSGVQAVDPIPNTEDSTATVFLDEHQLPDLAQWGRQFTKVVNGSYNLRGVEVTLDGTLSSEDAHLALTVDDRPIEVKLDPITSADKVQWDREAGQAVALTSEEADAYKELAAATGSGTHAQRVVVTGPLSQTGSRYTLKVRSWAT